MADDPQYDFVIIGSGFGGSVSAHRLTQKGYSVAVIEQGPRYRTDDLPESNWNLRKSIWYPWLGLRGILSITAFKDVVIFHGAGVGGGSLVYANTHLEPLDAFFTDPLWKDLADWRSELAPHYAEAKRMLGSVEAPQIYEVDEALRDVLTEMGTGDTFKRHTVGVCFEEAGEEVGDPYFDGEGPNRVGCTHCGSCMVGCTIGAKNSLDKNYLYFAEKQGAEVFADTRVLDIRALGPGDGSAGYEVLAKQKGLFGARRRFTASRVVLSAGAIGTVGLLFACKERGSLPRLSKMLGRYVRTNSESIQRRHRGRRNDPRRNPYRDGPLRRTRRRDRLSVDGTRGRRSSAPPALLPGRRVASPLLRAAAGPVAIRMVARECGHAGDAGDRQLHGVPIPAALVVALQSADHQRLGGASRSAHLHAGGPRSDRAGRREDGGSARLGPPRGGARHHHHRSHPRRVSDG